MVPLIKKIIASALCVTLCFSTLCGFISHADDRFDGDQYLSQTLINISDGEDITLGEINNYDRYERAYRTVGLEPAPEFKTEFISGGADHSHQYICANALRILANDKGDCLYFNGSNSDLLLEGSDWPDSHDIGAFFAAHFYNPYTEKNYGGSTSSTAKVKANTYYTEAVEAYQSGNITLALQKIGRGSHFVSDACETHHATNKTAVNSNHSAYEDYIDTVRTDAVFPNYTLDESVYQESLNCTVKQIVRNNSYASYTLLNAVTGNTSNPNYRDAARATLMNAMIANVQYFYKFAVEVGLY